MVIKATECNNEGALAFEYNLEDTDTVDGSIVFNGQTSVLWQNVRDAFRAEIRSMYTTLRSGQVFNYAHVQKMFEDHQAVWPERLWNEDAFTKYLQPYLLENKNYLDMLQGDKSSQRDWWLYNGFKYRDSKYGTGDAKANRIILRGYVDGDPDNPADAASIAAQMAAANITVTAYAHVYASAMFGSYTLSERLSRNQSHTFVNPMDYMNDTEIYIDSADQLSDVGDLSVLRLGKVADFSAATKLQQLIVGSSDSNYRNAYLQTLTVGNNELLTLVNMCNCTALVNPVDLSGCAGLETVLASGSSITGVQLPNGGHLKRLDLPATITNLTIQNQKNLTTFNVAGYNNLETLRIESTPTVPLETILTTAPALHRVRLTGVEWTATNEAKLKAFIDKLDTCIGMDANGNNTAKAVVTGRVNIASISSSLLERIQNSYPELVVVVNGVAQYLVRFFNYDNSVVYTEVVPEGGNAVNPITAGYCSEPTRPDEDGMSYVFQDWSFIPVNVHENKSVTAVYRTTCRVRYLNYNDAVLYTTYVNQGGSANYVGSTPTRPSDNQYDYTFSGWSGNQTNITQATDIRAQYSTTLRTWTVTWQNSDGTVLETDSNVPYGSNATYNGSTPVHPTNPGSYTFIGFQPNGQNITGNTTCVAQYRDNTSPFLKYLRREMTTYTSNTATAVGANAFNQATALTSVETTATSIGESAFNGCSNLATVDLKGTGATTIAASAFAGCTKLTALFIRSNTVATLSATSALPSDSFTSGMGVIYVPADLVSSYKSATNWSTFANRIYPISAYPVTDFSTISDSWAQIVAAGSDGTYASKYSVGDTKLMEDTDGKQFYMQLAAIDGDDLANDDGKAHMTWLIKDCYTTHNMNASNTTSGGWPATAMRTWLTDTVLAKLPDVVKNAIKDVTKTYYDYSSSSTLTSTDKIWIPSTREVCFTGSSLKENSGVQYSGLFTNNTTRIKYNNGSANNWWLRSATNGSIFYDVGSYGSGDIGSAGSTYGVVFGFCI